MADVIIAENTCTTNITIIVVHNGMAIAIIIPLEFILKTANDCRLAIKSRNNAD
jgi:hypothetical protein